MTKIVRKSLSDSGLSAGRKRRLQKLLRQPEREIDTSDIPELTEKFWQNAARNPFYRPLKKQLTLRLDADVIAWLRRHGRGYQTRANALLRDAMMGDFNSKEEKGGRSAPRQSIRVALRFRNRGGPVNASSIQIPNSSSSRQPGPLSAPEDLADDCQGDRQGRKKKYRLQIVRRLRTGFRHVPCFRHDGVVILGVVTNRQRRARRMPLSPPAHGQLFPERSAVRASARRQLFAVDAVAHRRLDVPLAMTSRGNFLDGYPSDGGDRAWPFRLLAFPGGVDAGLDDHDERAKSEKEDKVQTRVRGGRPDFSTLNVIAISSNTLAKRLPDDRRGFHTIRREDENAKYAPRRPWPKKFNYPRTYAQRRHAAALRSRLLRRRGSRSRWFRRCGCRRACRGLDRIGLVEEAHDFLGDVGLGRAVDDGGRPARTCPASAASRSRE